MARQTTTYEIERVPGDERSSSVLAFSGVVSIAIGAFVLTYPDPSLKLVGVLIGVNLLLAAVALIVLGVARLSPEGPGQSELLLGILALIAGVLVIRNPGGTVVLMAVALAIYLIVAGALALGRAIVSSEGRAASLAKGVLLAAAGTVIVVWPDLSRETFVWLAGIALLLQGAADIGEAFIAHSRRGRPA